MNSDCLACTRKHSDACSDITSQVYEEVKDFESLQTTVEEYLGEFNAESKQPMHLVMFGDAIDHVARISRVIRYSALGYCYLNVR